MKRSMEIPRMDRRVSVTRAPGDFVARDNIPCMLIGASSGLDEGGAAVTDADTIRLLVRRGRIGAGSRVMFEARRYNVDGVVPTHSARWRPRAYEVVTLGSPAL